MSLKLAGRERCVSLKSVGIARERRDFEVSRKRERLNDQAHQPPKQSHAEDHTEQIEAIS